MYITSMSVGSCKWFCWNLLFALAQTESTETASSETSNKACVIYYMATKQSIEHKGIYL